MLCTGIIILNIAGAKKTAKLQMGIVVCVLSVLVLFIGKGASQLDLTAYTPFVPKGWQGVISATGFVFISYAGVTKIASVVEEVKRPERNVPLGMLVSLAIMMAVYTLVVCVLIGTVPMGDLGADITAIATAAETIFGEVGRTILAIVAVLALTSMANAGLLSSSRYPFAMSRDQLLPPFLKSVHPKFRTPLASILLTGGLMLLLISFVDVEKLAKLASAFQIVVFSLVNLSVIIFRESHIEWYRPRFRTPAYPWGPTVGYRRLSVSAHPDGQLATDLRGRWNYARRNALVCAVCPKPCGPRRFFDTDARARHPVAGGKPQSDRENRAERDARPILR